MTLWASRSFLVKLLAANAAVLAVAFAVATWLTIRAGRGALEQLAQEDLSLHARSVLHEVDRHLRERGQEVRSWSSLDVMDDVLIEDRALKIENLLLALQREHPHFFSVLTVLDRSETILASTDIAQVGGRLSLQELSLRDVAGSDVQVEWVAPQDPEGLPRMVLVHPIVSRLHFEPIGWVLAEIDWGAVEGIVAQTVSGEREDTARFVALTDGAGRVLAADQGTRDLFPAAAGLCPRMRLGRSSTEKLGPAGRFVVACQGGLTEASILGQEAQVIALWRTAEAYALVRTFVVAVLGSATLGLAVAMGASFVIARGVTRRITKITEGTEKLAVGDLAYRVPEGADDELGRLARSFNAMASRLSGARETLESTLARWRALVAHAPDVIMTIDRGGTIVFVNRSVPGFSGDIALGSCVYHHVLPAYRETLQQGIEEVFRTGQAGGLEVAGALPPGKTTWYSCRLGPILRDGDVGAVTLIITDVTERKRLEREILEVDELERERIGQDLHDGLGQALTGISLLSKGLQQKLADTSVREAADAGQISTLINQAIEATRGLAQGLFPIMLEAGGLQGALVDLAINVDAVSAVACRLDVRSDLDVPDRTAARHLFRIAQEAVNNALRHGNPRSIMITVDGGKDRNRLTVEDDGVGIPEPLLAGRGMGLRLMRYRAEGIGASLEIRRRPEGGTIVTCTFPRVRDDDGPSGSESGPGDS